MFNKVGNLSTKEINTISYQTKFYNLIITVKHLISRALFTYAIVFYQLSD